MCPTVGYVFCWLLFMQGSGSSNSTPQVVARFKTEARCNEMLTTMKKKFYADGFCIKHEPSEWMPAK